MTVVAIRFGPTKSSALPRAIELASKLPSYRTDRGNHYVDEEVTAGNWKALFDLWTVVLSLKAHAVDVDGVPATPQAMTEIQAVYQCHDTREKAGTGDDHCLGVEAPGDDPAYLGCRFARGVRMVRVDDTYYMPPEWWRFGTLSPDLQSFLVDKAEILRRVRAQNGKSVAKDCPAWSLQRIERVVELLPSVLYVGVDWRLRHSSLNGTAVGVEPNGSLKISGLDPVDPADWWKEKP